MIHSKWADKNPMFGDQCSFIRINSSGGFWFSSNCSEEHSFVCGAQYHGQYDYIAPRATTTTTLLTQTEIVTTEKYVTAQDTTEGTTDAEISTAAMIPGMSKKNYYL